MRVFALVAVLAAVLAAGAGGAAVDLEAAPNARAAVPVQALERAITPQRLKAHLAALATIAGRNGGTRAVGTAGYSDSVAYVTRQLRAVGYRPVLMTFSFDFFRETKPAVFERVAPGLRHYESGQDFVTLRYSGGGSVTAQVVPVDFAGTSSGCEASDFAGFPDGAVALMRRGGCRFSDKAAAAEAAGAAAALLANDGSPGHDAPIMATLFGPGTRIPVLMVSAEVGSELAVSAQPRPMQVRIDLSVATTRVRAANVIAELPGRKSGIVLLGGHLDSVASGPGINDNGSGSALVLEVARQAKRLHLRPKHGLRFAFWGGEELGLLGSTSYVDSLNAKQRRAILAALNFDMVGSPNYSRIVYAGAGQPSGSLRIANAFHAYFAARGLPVDDASLGGSSDHAAFAEAGIPVGGLFTGADEEKTAAAAGRFGGSANRPLDACYHKACDTVANVDFAVLEQMTEAGAVVALRLAG
ncbi:MAG: M20/M25/M40 family metallo-hydrolase [Gaiellaceae bacterium]